MGLCWTIWAVLADLPSWSYVGATLSHFGSMLGPWGYVGLSGLCWPVLELCWGYVGQSWVYVEAILAHLGALLRLGWPVLDTRWGYFPLPDTPQTDLMSLKGIFC